MHAAHLPLLLDVPQLHLVVGRAHSQEARRGPRLLRPRERCDVRVGGRLAQLVHRGVRRVPQVDLARARARVSARIRVRARARARARFRFRARARARVMVMVRVRVRV